MWFSAVFRDGATPVISRGSIEAPSSVYGEYWNPSNERGDGLMGPGGNVVELVSLQVVHIARS